jgi:hypothetical protein
MPVQPIVKDDLDPISLDDEDDGLSKAASASSDPLVSNAASLRGTAPKIQAFGVSMGGPHVEHSWKRATVNTGKGICRVKSFHGRLSDQGMDYLDNTINEWLDAHPDVDVKNVTTNTNLFDGKVKELALIVNIWY